MQPYNRVVCCQRVELSGEKVCKSLYLSHADTMNNLCVLIEGMLRHAVLANLTFIVAGGLRINLISQNCIHGTNFVSFLQLLNVIPTITKPTRFPSN